MVAGLCGAHFSDGAARAIRDYRKRPFSTGSPPIWRNAIATARSLHDLVRGRFEMARPPSQPGGFGHLDEPNGRSKDMGKLVKHAQENELRLS
jgi:hypothetical protein